jgi:hypothetical protein
MKTIDELIKSSYKSTNPVFTNFSTNAGWGYIEGSKDKFKAKM